MRYLLIIVLWILLVSGSQTTEMLVVWETVYEDENVIIKHHYTLEAENKEYIDSVVYERDIWAYYYWENNKTKLKNCKFK